MTSSHTSGAGWIPRALQRSWTRIKEWNIPAHTIRLIPPIALSIALLPFVFARPVQQWIGSHSFFCYVLRQLAFYPGENTFVAHIEITVISLFLSSLWLGVGFVITCAQVWIDSPNPIYTSLKTRGLGAAYIFTSFFIAGAIWSRIPRLRIPLRAVMFTQVWVMTGSKSEITSRNFTDIFYPFFVCALLGIAANSLVPRTSNGKYFISLVSTLKTLSVLIETAMKDYEKQLQKWYHYQDLNSDDPDNAPSFEQSPEAINLIKTLKGQVQVTNNAFTASQHEVIWCLLPASSTKHFMTFVTDASIWLSSGWGMSMPSMDLTDPIFEEARAAEGDEAASVSEVSVRPLRMSYTNPATTTIIQRISMDHLTSSLTELRNSVLDIIALIQVLSEYSMHPVPSTYTHKVSATFCQAIHHYRLGDGEKFENPYTILTNAESKVEKAMNSCFVQLQLLLRERGFKESKNAQVCSPVASMHSSQDGTAQTRPKDTGTDISELFRKPSLFCPDMYIMSHFYQSLYHLANQAKQTIHVSIPMLDHILKHRHKRIFMPSLNIWRWFQTSSGIGSFGSTTLSETLTTFIQPKPTKPDISKEPGQFDPYSIVFDEDDRHTQYYNYARNMAKASRHTHRRKKTGGSFFERINDALTSFTHSPSAINLRVHVSSFLRSVKQSHHIRFGLKLAAGVTLFCIIPFLQNSPNDFWKREKGQWMLISYIWVLETSTGNTIRVLVYRIVGTVFGAVLGLIIYEISRGNVWALCVMVPVFDIPSAFIRLNVNATLGGVIGFTTPLVVMVTFLNPGSSAVHVAVVRGYMILLGVAAALLVNLIFWPYHARIQLMHKLSKTCTLLQNMYLSLARQRFYAGFKTSPELKSGFRNFEKSVRLQLAQCDTLLNIMTSEFSLVPKPVLIVRRIYEHMEMIFVLFVTLRSFREQEFLGDRQDALFGDLPLRQEFISSVILDLWLAGQVMVTRSKLPQSLPSTRRALEDLVTATALEYHELLCHDAKDNAKHKSFYDGPMIEPFAQTELLHSTDDVNDLDQAPAKTMGGLMYLLTEHSVLSQLVFSLESLLQLMRLIMGELHLVF